MPDEQSTAPPTLSTLKATQRRLTLRDALRRARLGYRLKKGAWRLTATLVWFSFLLHILGFGDEWKALTHALGNSANTLLTSVGLSPTDHHSLGLLRLAWLLIIT